MTNPRNCTTCRFLGPNDHPSRPECRNCGGAAEGWKKHQPRVISADPPCATCRHVQVFLAPIAPNATKPEPCGSCRQPLETHAAHEWRNHQLGDVAFPKWRIMEAEMLTAPYMGTADPVPEGQQDAAQQEAARRLFDRLSANAAAAGPAYWTRAPEGVKTVIDSISADGPEAWRLVTACTHQLLEATGDGRRCKACGASWSYSVAHDAERLDTVRQAPVTEDAAAPYLRALKVELERQHAENPGLVVLDNDFEDGGGYIEGKLDLPAIATAMAQTAPVLCVTEPAPVSALVDPAAINELEWLCGPTGEFVDDAQRLAALISAGQRAVTEHRRRVNELLEANEAEVNRRREAERDLERRVVAFEALLDAQIDTSRDLAKLQRLERLAVQFLSADALLGMMDTDESKAAAQAQLEQTKAALHEFFGTHPRESRGHA